MRKQAQTAWMLLAVCGAMASLPAFGQREQFPTMVPSPGAAAAPALPPGTPYTPLPPAGSPMAVPPPAATLNGTIQPLSPTWDPYGTAGTPPPSLFQQDPYFQGPSVFAPGGTFGSMTRLLQEVRFDYHWFAGHGSNEHELGINDVELSATFALPIFGRPAAPSAPPLGTPASAARPPGSIFITPGFAVHYWDGPASVPASPGAVAPDMPPQTFDAYLDTEWNPQVNQFFGAELSFRIGLYSDFKKFEEDTFRYTGKGVMVLSFSPSMKIKGGIWYIDRVRYKLLPAGGIVWAPPGGNTRFDILFPNPKFASRLTQIGNTEWWWYVSGDYGGGAWAIERTSPGVEGAFDQVDYNDIRVALGLEFKRLTGLGLNGLVEVGGAFNRELRYRGDNPVTFRPDSTVFVRGSLAF